eukprot:PhF_6_TR14965/c0_g1_i4/m.23493
MEYGDLLQYYRERSVIVRSIFALVISNGTRIPLDTFDLTFSLVTCGSCIDFDKLSVHDSIIRIHSGMKLLSPSGMCVIANGHTGNHLSKCDSVLCVCDTGNHRVVMFDARTGAPVGVVLNGFNTPNSVAWLGDYRIAVSDSRNLRIAIVDWESSTNERTVILHSIKTQKAPSCVCMLGPHIMGVVEPMGHCLTLYNTDTSSPIASRSKEVGLYGVIKVVGGKGDMKKGGVSRTVDLLSPYWVVPIDNHRCFLSDNGHNRLVAVHWYDWMPSFEEFSFPSLAAVGAAAMGSNLFVLANNGGSLHFIRLDGTIMHTMHLPGTSPLGVAMNLEGTTLYVSDGRMDHVRTVSVEYKPKSVWCFATSSSSPTGDVPLEAVDGPHISSLAPIPITLPSAFTLPLHPKTSSYSSPLPTVVVPPTNALPTPRPSGNNYNNNGMVRTSSSHSTTKTTPAPSSTRRLGSFSTAPDLVDPTEVSSSKSGTVGMSMR